ncbi:MAG: cupin [Robiginitomaculum sp.]|nr:MAG: cupin [Robiginitomaculum sp.]
MKITRKTKTMIGLSPDNLPVDELIQAGVPVILKGVARDWPLVRHGLSSPKRAMDYLKSFYNGKPVIKFSGSPEIEGRFFYNEDVSGLNFTSERIPLDQFLDQVEANLENAHAPSFYVGSTDLNVYLPGLRDENDLALAEDVLEHHDPLVSIWLGNRTCASAHYDFSNNIAGCMVGRRRFTMFPPEQVHNLYPGPLEPTPGGQVVSMVDFKNPDFEKYPKFKEAIAAGQVADMEAGDMLFIPSMWWHQVESLASFNILINYWWNTAPSYIDTPQTTLLHALLSLRDRPEAEKQAWRELFEYYVFGPSTKAGAHLPEAARGNLGPMDEMKARRLRALLLNRLNR